MLKLFYYPKKKIVRFSEIQNWFAILACFCSSPLPPISVSYIRFTLHWVAIVLFSTLITMTKMLYYLQVVKNKVKRIRPLALYQALTWQFSILSSIFVLACFASCMQVVFQSFVKVSLFVLNVQIVPECNSSIMERPLTSRSFIQWSLHWDLLFWHARVYQSLMNVRTFRE